MPMIHLVLLLGALLFSPISQAHSDEYLDTQATPHGGQMRMAGPFHYELVVLANGLQVHVTDHAGQTVDTQGANGTAITLSRTGKHSVPLVEAESGLLQGNGQFDPKQPLKAIITLNVPGYEPQTARFDTKTQLEKSHAAHQSHDHNH